MRYKVGDLLYSSNNDTGFGLIIGIQNKHYQPLYQIWWQFRDTIYLSDEEEIDAWLLDEKNQYMNV